VYDSCSIDKADFLFLYSAQAALRTMAFDLAIERDQAKNLYPRNGVLLPGVTILLGTPIRDALLSAGGADV